MPFDPSPLWISLQVASLATVAAFVSGLAAARWMLGYQGRWKSVIEGILVAPLILPPTVVGFLLLLLFGRRGPLGQLMQPFNISVVFTWYGAAIAATVVAFPLMYRTALGAFEQIDPTLLQVARTLGATQGRIFWRILLPLSVPGILAGLTLSFARALGEFGATLMLAGNIPGRTQTMPMAIYFAVEAGAMTEAWVWVGVIMVVSLSGIMAVNFWQQQQQTRYTKGSPAPSGQPPAEAIPSPRPLAPPLPRSSTLHPSTSHSPTSPLSHPPTLNVTLGHPLAHFPLRVSFQASHEALGILGASGSGKTMTLRCLAGIETPTQGRIVLNNRVLFDSQQGINIPSHQRRVGLVFQNYALFPHLTIAQNIAFGLQSLPALEQRQRISAWLNAMHLEGLAERYPAQLSGGQQQRVALARALAPAPDLLLLDEPLSALDTYLRSQVEQQLIETLTRYQGITLFVTHNLEEVFRVCPKIMVMAAGRPVAYGSKHDIFERPGTLTAARITGCKNFSTAVEVAPQTITAANWGCHLTVADSIPPDLAQVGFRAHQIEFIDSFDRPNTFPGWLVSLGETPHRVTLYLCLQAPPDGSRRYQLQAEVFKETWRQIKDKPQPWAVHLAPERLMLLSV